MLVFGCLESLLGVRELAVMGCPHGPPHALWQAGIDWGDMLAIGTGMLLLTPDRAEFQRLLRLAPSAESFDGADRQQSLNPQPETRNPKPETRNPKRRSLNTEL